MRIRNEEKKSGSDIDMTNSFEVGDVGSVFLLQSGCILSYHYSGMFRVWDFSKAQDQQCILEQEVKPVPNSSVYNRAHGLEAILSQLSDKINLTRAQLFFGNKTDKILPHELHRGNNACSLNETDFVHVPSTNNQGETDSYSGLNVIRWQDDQLLLIKKMNLYPGKSNDFIYCIASPSPHLIFVCTSDKSGTFSVDCWSIDIEFDKFELCNTIRLKYPNHAHDNFDIEASMIALSEIEFLIFCKIPVENNPHCKILQCFYKINILNGLIEELILNQREYFIFSSILSIPSLATHFVVPVIADPTELTDSSIMTGGKISTPLKYNILDTNEMALYPLSLGMPGKIHVLTRNDEFIIQEKSTLSIAKSHYIEPIKEILRAAMIPYVPEDLVKIINTYVAGAVNLSNHRASFYHRPIKIKSPIPVIKLDDDKEEQKSSIFCGCTLL